MNHFAHNALVFILVINFVLQLEAVTVNPLAPMCPTNKIAPRRKRHEKNNPRTLGIFYNLLRPDSPSGLQEKPQADDPNDCGEIEDYDENDISSVTQQVRRQGQNQLPRRQYNFFNLQNFNNKPTRPPPAGYFGTNSYTPPKPQEPTDYVKPVHEGGQDPQMNYRPGLVGAPIGHVIGLPQKHGSRPPSDLTPVTPNRKNKYANHGQAHPQKGAQANYNTNKHHRTRKFSGDSGILGSFVDLFF